VPRSIATQRITKNRIAGKSIATRYGLENLPAPYQFPPGSHTFRVPITGYWKFVAWGMGGFPTAGGGASGAYVEITRMLRKDTIVTIAVARLEVVGDSRVTFPNGDVAIAGSASGSTPGMATGGDVSVNGSNGGATGANNGVAGLGTNGGRGGGTASGTAGGGGAPANLPFKGGDGGGFLDGTTRYAATPGGGGYESLGTISTPGNGQVIAFLVRE
jgi:hypothetical protein